MPVAVYSAVVMNALVRCSPVRPPPPPKRPKRHPSNAPVRWSQPMGGLPNQVGRFTTVKVPSRVVTNMLDQVVIPNARWIEVIFRRWRSRSTLGSGGGGGAAVFAAAALSAVGDGPAEVFVGPVLESV